MARYYRVADMYGTFNDPNNWSLESGGEGGAGVPGTGDVACFDENSFSEITYTEVYVEIISVPNYDQIITSPDISCSFDLTGCTKNLFLRIQTGASLSLESDLIGLYNLSSFGGNFYSNGYDIKVLSLEWEESSTIDVSGSEITIEGTLEEGCSMAIYGNATLINEGTTFILNSWSMGDVMIFGVVIKNLIINLLNPSGDADTLFWFGGADDDDYLAVIDNLTINGNGHISKGGE